MILPRYECFPFPGQPILPELDDAALNSEALKLSEQVRERLQKLPKPQTGNSERIAAVLLAIPQKILTTTAWRLSSTTQSFRFWQKECMGRFSAIGEVMDLGNRDFVKGINSNMRFDGSDLFADARAVFELCCAAKLNPIIGWCRYPPQGAYNGLNAERRLVIYIRWNLPGETRSAKIRRWLLNLFA